MTDIDMRLNEMCTAAWWDGQAAPLYCSLPLHEHGHHAAHRLHDPSLVPPLRTWVFKRNDQPAYSVYEAEVRRITSLTKEQLFTEEGRNILDRMKIITDPAGFQAKKLAAKERAAKLIADARFRRNVSGII